jgi:hypothetical protein
MKVEILTQEDLEFIKEYPELFSDSKEILNAQIVESFSDWIKRHPEFLKEL